MRNIGTIGSALSLSLGTAQCGFACSCPPREWSKDVMGKATAVFAGIPVSVYDPNKGPLISSEGPLIYSFVVTHVWRGDVAETLRVTTRRYSASCGYEFELGRHYLVHAGASDGSLWTTQCSDNDPVEYALWDRYWLPDPIFVSGEMPLSPVRTEDLVEALDSDDRRLQFAAAYALAHLDDQREDVIEVLQDVVRNLRPGNQGAAIGAQREVGQARWRAAAPSAPVATAVEADGRDPHGTPAATGPMPRGRAELQRSAWSPVRLETKGEATVGDLSERQEKLLVLFKSAIEREREAQKAYSEMLPINDDPTIKRIIEAFIRQEQQHEETLMRMYNDLRTTGEFKNA
jgi:hypothetical protein